MNQLGMVHPNLTTRLRNSFPSTATIQQFTATQDENGCDIQAWADVSGLTSLKCRFGPARNGRKRTPDQIYDRATHIAALASYQSSITTNMRAVIDSINYTILNVRHDDAGRTTALDMEIVT